MAEEKEIAKDSDFKETRAPVSTNLLLTLVLIVNVVVMGAIGFFQFKVHKKISETPSIQDVVKAEMKALEKAEADATGTTPDVKEQEGILFPLDPFTANLAQGDGPRRYIRLNAVLKFSKGSNEEEFKARKAQIRDSIISILNAKRPEDLLKPEGKSFLKEEIKSSINSFLVDGSAVDVYYVGLQIH